MLLRDHVPRVREALLLLTWSLRRLEGQSISFETAKSIGVLPGSHALNKSELDQIHQDLIRALVLLEGCLPIVYLIPTMHHLVHYVDYSKTHGILRFYWMMAFERYNKYIKNLVRDMHRAEVNLSRNLAVDVACSYNNLQKKTMDNAVGEASCHKCVLSGQCPLAEVADDELENLMYLGCPATDADDVNVFSIAWILGKHFRSGEWGMTPRCGSVITCVINGRSLYAPRVLKFLQVDGDTCPGYAVVRWFSEPTYVNRLCPRVTLDGSDIEREVGVNVVRITQIDPCQVAVENDTDTDYYYMMRDSGYDTLRS